MTESGGHPGGAHPGGAHPGGGQPGGHGAGASYFDEAYQGTAPWDIGRVQPALAELETAGRLGRNILDIGCGTGENSLYMASKGHEVTGVDSAEVAIERARAKATERGLAARFIAQDVFAGLEDPALGGPFDAVIDCGFFHALDDTQRRWLAKLLANVIRPGGLYAMLVFSDRVPGTFGPRRVSEDDIRETFTRPLWRVVDVRPAELETAIPSMPVLDANLALIERA